MDPYAYVGNNPEGRTDPTGHCWPWCTALIGAAVGAVIGVAVTTVTSYATTGKPPSGGELLQAAVSGAVSGAIVGVLGPGASVVGAIGIGALTGAAGGVAGRLAYNAVTRTSLSTGLLEAGVEGAVIGGLTGGVFKAAAPLLGRIGRAVVDDASDAPSVLNPNNIRFTQNEISSSGRGYTVQGNINGLRNGTLNPFSDFPAIRVFVKTSAMDNEPNVFRIFPNASYLGHPSFLEEGLVYTLDYRRLYAFQQAGVPEIPVIWADYNTVLSQIWKFDTQNFGVSIHVH